MVFLIQSEYMLTSSNTLGSSATVQLPPEEAIPANRKYKTLYINI